MTDELDWTQVHAFVRVARHGSLSKAARSSGVSQPTLGRRIQALERALGVTLFDRGSGALVPTPTAATLLEHADGMAAAASRLSLAASGRSQAIAGTVRLSASEVMATHLLPAILVALRRDEPRIDIELVASNDSGNLLRREADIAVRMYRPDQADVITRHVSDLPVAAYATPGYLARHGEPSSIAEVADHELVGHDTDEQLLRGFRRAGLPLGREAFSFRCDDHTACWQLVVAGWGIGFTLRQVGDADARVQPVFGGADLDVLPVWLTAHAELRTSARVRRVYDHLAQTLGALRAPAGTAAR